MNLVSVPGQIMLDATLFPTTMPYLGSRAVTALLLDDDGDVGMAALGEGEGGACSGGVCGLLGWFV